MKRVLVCVQSINAAYGEVHDSLDSRWQALLFAAKLLPVMVPNNPGLLPVWLSHQQADGVLLTGGGNHDPTGGDSRSQTEIQLLAWAQRNGLPVLGVCRGMQTMLKQSGMTLQPLQGHVRTEHQLDFPRKGHRVNSFHDYGITQVPASIEVLARAEDGVIEAIEVAVKRWLGIMWHPERNTPFDPVDVTLINQFFDENQSCRD